MGQPEAGTGRSAVASPFVTAGAAAPGGEGDDLAALLVQGGEGGEKLALEVVENRGEVRHEYQTIRTLGGAIESVKDPPIRWFCKSLKSYNIVRRAARKVCIEPRNRQAEAGLEDEHC